MHTMNHDIGVHSPNPQPRLRFSPPPQKKKYIFFLLRSPHPNYFDLKFLGHPPKIRGAAIMFKLRNLLEMRYIITIARHSLF